MNWDNAEVRVSAPGEQPVRYVLDGMQIRYEPYEDAAGKHQLVHVAGILKTFEQLPKEVPAPAAPVASPPTEGPVFSSAAQSTAMHDLWMEWKDCKRCPLATVHRRNVVFGSGNSTTPKILVIGEAPGPEENVQGIPFIGPTGQMLRNGLTRVGLVPDDDCFITNSVLCFPTENGTQFRGPKGSEMLACRPRMSEQFRILGSTLKAVLLVGKRSYVDFFKRDEMEATPPRFEVEKDFEQVSLKKFLGWHAGPLPWPHLKVMTVYHPSYFARQKLTDASSEVQQWYEDLRALADWTLRDQFWNPRPIK